MFYSTGRSLFGLSARDEEKMDLEYWYQTPEFLVLKLREVVEGVAGLAQEDVDHQKSML